MDNQDKATFSLDDEEIVEEEVIDRDEEYEDDDYDDEEYDDEEEYDDDGYDDEEEYDDGYNDDYYDDRLNKVLDELAELKRGMAPANIQPQQSIMPPQYIYQPTAPPAGSEIVMYNEISRLRDELAKNQNSLEMQKEITRIKEDMARDQKFAESQYNAEIKRLQDRIDDLLKNGSGPQGELPYTETARIEGGNSTLDIDKLLSINEAILRLTRDSDAKLQSEIGQLKKQLDEIPSAKELGNAVSAVKKAVGNMDGIDPATVEKLSSEIAALKVMLDEKGLAPVQAAPIIERATNDHGDIGSSELLRQLYALKTTLGNASEDVAARAQALYAIVGEYKKINYDVHSQTTSYKDKLNSVYSFAKKLEDVSGADAVDLIAAVNALIGELAGQKLTESVFSDTAAYCNEHGMTNITPVIRDSADRYFTLCRKLAEAKPEAYGDYLPDLLKEINTLEGGKKDSVNAAAIGEITEMLLDDKADKSVLAGKVGEFAELKVSDILDLPVVSSPKAVEADDYIEGESVFAKLAEIKSDIEKLSASVANPAEVEQPTVSLEEQAAAVDETAVKQMLDAIEQLKAKLEAYTDVAGMAESLEEIRKGYVDISGKLVDISEKIQNSADKESEQAAASEPSEVGEAMANDIAYIRGKLDEYAQLVSDINELRNAVLNIGAPTDMTAQFGEQTTNIVSEITAQFDKLYEDLSNVLLESESNIINKLGEGATEGSADNATADILADTQAIKDSLAVVSDAVPALADSLENAKADILADTHAIKDSLFNVTDTVPSISDAIENAKLDILADTQAIKDSLFTVTDSVLASPINDAVEQLRADLNAYIDQYSVNADAAATDRQRLIDDVAFLREQAEFAISEDEQIPDGATAVQDTDKLVGYLDEIAARVAQIADISENVAANRETLGGLNDTVLAVNNNMATVSETVFAVNDTVAAINDSVINVSDSISVVADTVNAVNNGMTTVNDTVTSVNDTVLAVNDNIAALNENIAAVNDNVVAVSDNVNAVADGMASVTDGVNAARDAANAALDALAPISDKLSAILDKLDTPVESSSEYTEESESSGSTAVMADEELIELKDSLNTILDTLPLFPQADDVITARDNTYAILDTLALMPQADDVTATRDNVAAIFEVINTLSDNIGALLATLDKNEAENIESIRDTVVGSAENIEAIRSKLEGDDNASVGEIAGNIELLLDKIEQYGKDSETNKQEIITAIGDIREEIHINTLDENMSAAGMDGETRDALLGEIAEIRERLGNIESVAQEQSDVNVATLEGINAQLSDLQAVLADRLAVTEDTSTETSEMSDENMQALVEQLAAIRERLDAAPEYDTVEEILSLRDDIKAARIVDQDEVSGELESIKNELAAISSGNILDEIRALREDIANIPTDGVTPEATDGEINLVLNEIVSLRDEVFAFKDEVLNATLTAEQQDVDDSDAEARATSGSDDMGLILDELTSLRADQSTLTENIDELKDIISRRASIASDTDGADGATGELNVVLDEIINLKNDIERVQESVGAEKLDDISAQVEDIRNIIEELRGGTVESSAETETADASFDITPIMEQFDNVNAALDELRLNRDMSSEDGAAVSSVAERFDSLQNDIEEIKTQIQTIVPQDYASEIAELRAEIDALRAENEMLKANGTDSVSAQIADLKETIHDMALAMTPPSTADGDTSYAALIDEIRELKEQVSVAAPAQVTLDEETLASIRDALMTRDDNMSLSDELGEIRDEIAQLRSLTTVAAESGGLSEVAAIRDEIEGLKAMFASPDSLLGVAEDVTAIKTDVQTLKEEPDLGVMNEILALRDEFQALREQIEDVKRIAGETDKQSDESLMNEVQSLRDQLFAISMANVNDPASGESNYESYNNIILDELASLRDQMNEAGSAGELAAISDEFAQLKATLDKREAVFEALSDRVSKFNNDATNNRILEELASLRTDMANQREADLTTLNFMSEMAHLLERQNQYLTQNAGSKISDEIESLKAEIASSDAVAEEVAKLREIMTQTGNASDNDTILNELADLREELSSEKPSRENALILDAIARLRDEITTLAEREKVRDMDSDANLSDSLTDLKEQLNEIAGIVEPTERIEEKATVGTANKPTVGAKRGRKPGQKNGTGKAAMAKKQGTAVGGAKRGRKPGQKNKTSKASTPVAQVTERPVTIDLDAIINEQSDKLGGNSSEMVLDPHVTTNDAMDVADKLAKQVANKLVMEQLVEQLGDGGVSDERVDEILRDILPQEFTTIAVTEESDKVRKLANQLVLNKLRSRLNGNNPDEK